ncbi:MAG TPA: hypothetical protein PLP28_13615, partial [Flavobacteriales bacterium]|nr:hypothetical protein [Flavobacteriales bacterium]
MNKRTQVAKYVMADLFASATAWTLFYLFRKVYMEPAKFQYKVPVEFDANYWWGLVLVPVFWTGLYLVIGGYADVYRRFRIKELGQTLLISLIGSLGIFFVLLLDDTVANYRYYYRSFLVLFGLNFAFTFLLRYIITSRTVKRVHGRQIGFNT